MRYIPLLLLTVLQFAAVKSAPGEFGQELEKLINVFRASQYDVKTPPARVTWSEQLVSVAEELLVPFREGKPGASKSLEDGMPTDTAWAFSSIPLIPAQRLTDLDLAKKALVEWQQEDKYDGDFYKALTLKTNKEVGIFVGKMMGSETAFVLGLFRHAPLMPTKKDIDREEAKQTLAKLLPVAAKDTADEAELEKLFEALPETMAATTIDDQMTLVEQLNIKVDLLTLKTQREAMIEQQKTAKNLPDVERNRLYALQLHISWLTPLVTMTMPANSYDCVTQEYVCGSKGANDQSFQKQLQDLITHSVGELMGLNVKVPPNANPAGETFDQARLSKLEFLDVHGPAAPPRTFMEILFVDYCSLDRSVGGRIIYDVVKAGVQNTEIRQGLQAQAGSPQRNWAEGMIAPEVALQFYELAGSLLRTRKAISRDAFIANGDFKKKFKFDLGARVRIIEDRLLDYCLLSRPVAYANLNENDAVCGNKQSQALSEIKFQCPQQMKQDTAWQDIVPTDGSTDVTAELKKGYHIDQIKDPSLARALAVRYCGCKDLSPLGVMIDEIVAAQEAEWKNSKAGPDQIKKFGGLLRQFARGAAEKLRNAQATNLADVKKKIKSEFRTRWKAALKIHDDIGEILKQPNWAINGANRKAVVVKAFKFCLTIMPYSFNMVNKHEVCELKAVNTEVVALMDCAKTEIRSHGDVILNQYQLQFSHYLVKAVCSKSQLLGEYLGTGWFFKQMFRGKHLKAAVANRFGEFKKELLAIDHFWQWRADAAITLTQAGVPKET